MRIKLGTETKLSILMPFKNSGPYIEECIQSMLDQDFKDWELIVVDDHSADEAAEIVQNFGQKNPQITLLKNSGKGIIDALKTAYDHSSGSFITRMDSDDIMPAGRLMKMVNILSNVPDKTIVTGKVKYFSDGEVSQGYRDYEHWLSERIDKEDHWNWIYRECVIASPNWMARKEDLEAINAFHESTYPEDYDLVLRWYVAGFNVRSIPDVTLLWREHPDRTSRNSEHYAQSYFFQLKLDYFLRIDYNQDQLILLGAGEKGKLAANFLAERNINFLWMEKDPKLIGQRIYGEKIEAFDASLLQKPSQVLVSVYPSIEERELIEAVLVEVDWWWL